MHGQRNIKLSSSLVRYVYVFVSVCSHSLSFCIFDITKPYYSLFAVAEV
jgi:hypothetical protein